MCPLTVSHVSIEHQPGHPSQALVIFNASIRLNGIQVWPARHGPLVLFPLDKRGLSPIQLTPLVRTLVVQSVVAAWRKSKLQNARIAA